MSPSTHAILSELHKLLSTYTIKDFQEAKKYPGLSRWMRSVLEALCREAAPKEKSHESWPKEQNTNLASIRPSSGRRVTSDDPDALFMAIRHSAYFDNIRTLNYFARKTGIKQQSRPKESKDKFARRLARAILLLPQSKREQAIADLGTVTKSQTEGWIDVIRNTSHE